MLPPWFRSIESAYTSSGSACPRQNSNTPTLPVTRKALKELLEPEARPKYTLSLQLWNYLQDYAEKHRARATGSGCDLVDPNQDSRVTRTLSARYYKDGSEILIDQAREIALDA